MAGLNEKSLPEEQATGRTAITRVLTRKALLYRIGPSFMDVGTARCRTDTEWEACFRCARVQAAARGAAGWLVACGCTGRCCRYAPHCGNRVLWSAVHIQWWLCRACSQPCGVDWERATEPANSFCGGHCAGYRSENLVSNHRKN